MYQVSYAITDAAERAGASQVGPDGTWALFYNRPVLNEAQTQIEGRPIFDTVPYIKLRFAGNSKKIIDKAVKPEHQQRFAQAWRAFQEGLAGPTGGTPIEAFHILSMAQQALMRHLGIVTVEQLAQVSDTHLAQLGPGGQALRERAKAWLQGDAAEVKTTRALLLEMEGRLEHLASENEALRNQLLADGKRTKKTEAEAA